MLKLSKPKWTAAILNSNIDALRRGAKNTQKSYTKNFHDPDSNDGVITPLEPDIL